MKKLFKSITALILMTVMIVGIIPSFAVKSNAASAIKLSVPFFCQRSANVCVNACVSMVEGYYYGYGQNNTYVYNTVMDFNPGAALNSTTGKKMGYTSIDCTMQDVYNQFAAGKPVIIQREGHFRGCVWLHAYGHILQAQGLFGTQSLQRKQLCHRRS